MIDRPLRTKEQSFPVNQLRMLGSGPNRGEATGRCRLAADIRKWPRLILLPVYLTNIAVIW